MTGSGQFTRGGPVGKPIATPVRQEGVHISGGNFYQRCAVDCRPPMQLQKTGKPICRGMISADAMRRHPAIVGQERQIFGEQ